MRDLSTILLVAGIILAVALSVYVWRTALYCLGSC